MLLILIDVKILATDLYSSPHVKRFATDLQRVSRCTVAVWVQIGLTFVPEPNVH